LEVKLQPFALPLAFAGLILLCPSITSAKDAADAAPRDGSLGAYLERALDASPLLMAFEHRHRAAKARIPQEGALPNPQFQLTHFVESIQTRTGPQENAFVLSQRLPWFGTLGERERAAGAEAEALWYAWQNQHLQVALEAGTLYFDFALAYRQIELVEQNLKLLRQALPSVEERVRGGASLDALLRLQLEVGRLEDRLASLRSSRKVLTASLRETLVLDPPTELPQPYLETVLPPPMDGPSLNAALERNNPELAMLRSRIENAEARQALARLESYPDISLGINYIQIGDPVAPTPDAGKDAWGGTVGISIPLWFGRNRSARLEAMESRRALEADYRDRLVGLKAELSRRMTRLQDVARTATLYKDDLLPLARQSVEISRARYESGEGTFLAWVDSERSLLELDLRYWEAVAMIAKQHLALQVLVNRPVAGIRIMEADE